MLQYGQSALHCASFSGKTECLKVLVEYGAQVDLPVRCDVQKWIQGCGILFGQTGQLIQFGWVGYIWYRLRQWVQYSFLQVHAGLSDSTPWCFMWLITCIHYDLKHWLRHCVLLKLIQDEDGNTALIEACRGGHAEAASVLLDHGANIDYQNKVIPLCYS